MGVANLQIRHGVAIAAVVLWFAAGAVVRWRIEAGPDGSPWKLAGERLDFSRDVEPLLHEHCYECHGDGSSKGDLALDEFASPAEREEAVDFWLGVHRTVEGRVMPPSDRATLADQDQAHILEWIERDVFRLDPAKPDPGRVAIRRLNREEYRNSLRDLLGDLPVDPAADLPPDDTGYGFDNIGEVLSMSPELLEKYVLAAERVLGSVIRTEPPEPDRLAFEPEEHFRGVQHIPNGTGTLASQGAVGVRLPVAREGEYRIRILAGADHAGQELPLMEVKVPGLLGEKVEIAAGATRSRPAWREFRVRLPKKEHWLEMAFLNDHYEPNHPDPLRRDRNLHLLRVELVGPIDEVPPPPSAVQQRIVASGGEGTDRQRAERILAAFGRMAWRRPLSAVEVERLAGFVDLGMEEGESFEAGLKLAFTAVIISPNFLFRGEGVGDPPPGGRVVAVSELELASRLSFFLWSSLPDERLLGLAESGRLRSRLGGEIERMLLDPRARALTANFAGQWLQLRNLDTVAPDSRTFPAWSPSLREAMRRETEEVFSAVFRENRALVEFLDSDYTFLNEPLARHYGIGGVSGEQFRRVSLSGTAREQRGGLLTHASILTITSHPTRTSPVNRGNWILENILGTPPPPPAANVPALEESAGRAANSSLRAQLEAHRAAPLCASCHRRMDPLGLAMENYDAIGAWRTGDGGQDIDPSGAVEGLGKFSDFRSLRALLVQSREEDFVRTLASALLTYALGRGLEYYDKPALAEIQERVERSGLRPRELVLAVVESVPFQFRRGPDFGGEGKR